MEPTITPRSSLVRALGAAAGLALVAAAVAVGASHPLQGVPDSDTSFKGPPKGAGSSNGDSDKELRGPPKPQPSSQQGSGYASQAGMVDATTLQQAATGGVHYHFHYYGGTGYAGTTLMNPANAPNARDPASMYSLGTGPGNPEPLGSGDPNDGNAFVGSHTYTGVGEQYWSGTQGGVGAWNPYVYGGEGYIAGFDD
ncbi:MAG: hypothetical protein U0574_01965 [Phycisphaerales bacterium]